MTESFDMSLVQRGARNRRTPYYEATQRYGPKGMTVYNHMYFPIRFDSFEAEFDALLNGVTLWDVAVNRVMAPTYLYGNENQEIFLPEERLDLATSIAAFTMGSAFVNHLDDMTGSIEVGKYADLAVVDLSLIHI